MDHPTTSRALDKVCLVTGGTDGIGKATALGLAKLGATVVLVGRNAVKAGHVVDEIRRVTQNPQIEAITADLASLNQVRKLAENFKARYKRLDVLVNNAGLVTHERELSEDGFELMFAVNYLAPFLLTNLLLDVIQESVPARIVNVASMSYKWGKIDFDDLQSEQNFDYRRAYYQTRLGMVLFTFALARRLEGSGVTANVLHPGIVKTNLSYNYMGNPVLRFFEQLIAVSPQKGAETGLYLATSPEVAGITGEYFTKKKVQQTTETARNQRVQERLWELSAALSERSVSVTV
ncbi:MAG: SDR family oxidoreductase [Caldilinea sp.]|jgi:NAD(P)-dependent dehydrogenase (short-subunit alcohol dehydrogenase family)